MSKGKQKVPIGAHNSASYLTHELVTLGFREEKQGIGIEKTNNQREKPEKGKYFRDREKETGKQNSVHVFVAAFLNRAIR